MTTEGVNEIRIETDARPTPKVTAAGLGGAVTTLIVFLAGPDISPEVAAAIATLVSFAAGYLRG